MPDICLFLENVPNDEVKQFLEDWYNFDNTVTINADTDDVCKDYIRKETNIPVDNEYDGRDKIIIDCYIDKFIEISKRVDQELGITSNYYHLYRIQNFLESRKSKTEQSLSKII